MRRDGALSAEGTPGTPPAETRLVPMNTRPAPTPDMSDLDNGRPLAPSRQADSILTELDLRREEFFVGGSGPMALRDMRPLGDLDIGVTTGYWFQLWCEGRWGLYTPPTHSVYERCDPPYLFREVQGVMVHVFFAWRLRDNQSAGDSDYNRIFQYHLENLYREGFTRAWPCIRLGLLLKLKGQEQRDKDYPDIARIAEKIIEEGVS